MIRRKLWIKNWDSISIVFDSLSWAFPFNVDLYPGRDGWTWRFRILCLNIHIRTVEVSWIRERRNAGVE